MASFRERLPRGRLGLADVGRQVGVVGWVDALRDHGVLLFAHLRDRSGIAQVVFSPEVAPDVREAAAVLREEFCVAVTGRVVARAQGTENPALETGQIEVVATGLTILSRAEVLPFPISEKAMVAGASVARAAVAEDLRLQYRYLDLRRPSMQDNLIKRHRIIKAARDCLDERGFIEVETPVLTKSTPEGARDYLVPSRVHPGHFYMEEDVAKLVHETEGKTRISLVDFNRAGAPLVEIVTEPDMRSPYDAMEFLRALRAQIRYVGSAECSMARGTMRADANVSLRPRGCDDLNTKVEVKNMNSVRHVGDAIAYEIQRQTERLNAGGTIVLHTRLWDPDRGVTTPMRGKFAGPCVPDPSVPEIVISQAWLDEMRSRLPEMPALKRERFVAQYGLTQEEATLMSSDRDVAEYFEATAGSCGAPRAAANWIATQLLPALRDRDEPPAETAVTPQRLAELIQMVERGEVNANAAKEVFARLFESDRTPAEIVEEGGLKQVTDTAELEAIVDRVLAANPRAVADVRNGKTQAAGFLVGQAMRASGGKADPKLLRELVAAKLP